MTFVEMYIVVFSSIEWICTLGVKLLEICDTDFQIY